MRRIPASKIATTEAYVSTIAETSAHALPAARPKRMRTKFQIKVATVVNKTKRSPGILAIPAGIEIKLRITGTNRPKKIVLKP